MSSYLKSRSDLFKIQAFRWYIISCTLAMLGNGLSYIAMVWAVAQGHHQVTRIAILMACFWLPGILLGPLAGVLVDRYSRKTIIVICNAARVLLLLVFYYVIQNDTPPPLAVYALSLTIGSFLSLYIPASMTMVREIVPEKKLMHANATVDMAYELGSVVGMGFAGLIIAASSLQFTFLINAVLYIFATLATLVMHYQKKSQLSNHEHFFSQLKKGANYLLARKPLVLMYSVQMLFFACYMTAPVLLAPFAKSVLHADAAAFGYIESAMSLGIVIGGLLSPWLAEKYSTIKIVALEALIGSLAFALFCLNDHLGFAIFLYAFIGFCFSAWALIISYAQDKTELAYQGRVQSLFNSLSGVIILVFYCVLSFVGEYIHIQSLYWVEVLMLISSLLLLVRLNREDK